MFCNKTNADGVSLHQFPADESVYGRWLTKLYLGQFSRRKKAQRGIRSTLFLFQCVTWGI